MGASSRVNTFYDVPMWQSVDARRWALQRCSQCRTFRYPPSPVCANCQSLESEWVPLKGTGTILSWTVFHKKYFDDHPPPYNCIAVRLDEGPIIVTNLSGRPPTGDWIGQRVRLVYEQVNGAVLPRAELDSAAA
jgi:uncharacterized OB-fold protein